MLVLWTCYVKYFNSIFSPSLMILQRNNGKISNCVGSLVTSSFILTAAHCFRFGDTSDRITVDLGSDIKGNIENYLEYSSFFSSNGVNLISGVSFSLLRNKSERLHTSSSLWRCSKTEIGNTWILWVWRGSYSVGETCNFGSWSSVRNAACQHDMHYFMLLKSVKIVSWINAYHVCLYRPICIPCTKETSGALKLSNREGTCIKHRKLQRDTSVRNIACGFVTCINIG